MFRLKLKETNNQVKKLVAAAIKEEFDVYIYKTLQGALPLIRLKFLNFMHQSEAFNEISKGELAGELGLPFGSGSVYLYNVLQRASQNIQIQYMPDKDGGKSILYLREGWQQDLLSNYQIIYSKNGFEVPWLKWLLTAGSNIVISDHTFKPRPWGTHGASGRSLQGIMIKHNNWKVPGEHAGTEDDNFITRLFDDFSRELNSVYQDVLNV